MQLLLTFVLLMAFGACRQAGFREYEQLVAAGKKPPVRTDTLFMGISLGMPNKAFFAHCWEMNKKGIFTDGNSNTAILYRLHPADLKHPASMTFYPQFFQNKVSRLQVNFRYDGWAPWNTNLHADALRKEVLALMRRWYPAGNPFLQLKDPKRGTIYVKVDNNRRIVIGSYDDMNVKVDFSDLTVSTP